MIPTERFDQVQISSLDELRAWLQSSWGRDEGVWLVRFKKNVPEKFVDRLDMIDELLCYGWVDGIARRLDDQRTMQIISPRKQQAWAESYKKRIERLNAEGRMAAAGLAAVAQAKASGTWDAYSLVDMLVIPDDLTNAFGKYPDALAFFERSAPSYRRNVLRWISQAKKPETRLKRIAATLAASQSGERMPQM